MLFNDLLVLESSILLSILFYLLNSNILMLLYTGFFFLISCGMVMLMNDADIYIGFLWLIDLGVGLVFFIFVLHFSTFLSQKSQNDLNLRFKFILSVILLVILLISYVMPQTQGQTYLSHATTNWTFKLINLDYYLIYNSSEITELNTLKESYFMLNSYEFLIINFALLFGLISAVLLFFLIKRIFVFMNFNYLNNIQLFNRVNTNFFIRTQDYVKQQRSFMTVRSWLKLKRKLKKKPGKKFWWQ